jgi:hypothetical protein
MTPTGLPSTILIMRSSAGMLATYCCELTMTRCSVLVLHGRIAGLDEDLFAVLAQAAPAAANVATGSTARVRGRSPNMVSIAVPLYLSVRRRASVTSAAEAIASVVGAPGTWSCLDWLRSRPRRRCRPSWPDPRERRPSRLVATAEEDRLNFRRAQFAQFAAVGDALGIPVDRIRRSGERVVPITKHSTRLKGRHIPPRPRRPLSSLLRLKILRLGCSRFFCAQKHGLHPTRASSAAPRGLAGVKDKVSGRFAKSCG